MQHYGKIMVVIGAVILMAGLLLWIAGDKLNWLGKLPGDIKVEKENFRFYMPVTTMILISVIVSLIVWIFKKMQG